jgi:hypothetical protein
MSPRHISSQSFDDILSELGDDPAIQDPHGIRKTSASTRPSPENQVKSKSPSFSIPELHFSGLKTIPTLIISTLFIITIAAVFFLLESNKANAEVELHALQSQIAALKNELSLAQSDWLIEEESLYNAMDELEVSIHSKIQKAPLAAPQNKPVTIPYEAELRRWRYLGLARMGATEQAFFHTGKTTLMVSKEGLALGEWHLTRAEKEVAILTHSKGKSITLKSTKPE